MRPYLDLFLIMVVLFAATSGGEAAGGRRSVVGGIKVKMPRGEVAWGCWLFGGIEIQQIGGEAAAKCWVKGRLEFRMPDGEDTSWLCPVTEGRVENTLFMVFFLRVCACAGYTRRCDRTLVH